MTNTAAPLWESGRFSVDPRFRSQLAYVRGVAVTAIGGRPPSDSQLVRRAVGLLAEHYETLIRAGRIDGLRGPHETDALAERVALAEYARVIDAEPPRSFVDTKGYLRSWAEAIEAGARKSLTIPERPRK